MVHVVATFWVCACFYLVHRLLIELGAYARRGQTLALLALCSEMAVVSRPSNAFVLVLVGLVAWDRWRRRIRYPIRWVLVAALLAAAPVAAQMAVWKAISGSLVLLLHLRG